MLIRFGKVTFGKVEAIMQMNGLGRARIARKYASFLSTLIVGVSFWFVAVGSFAEQDTPLFSFGAIADVQYCDCDSASTRFYRSSPTKLAACVEAFNQEELEFVVHLGDLIDRRFASYSEILPVLNELRAPIRHTLGNHDYGVKPAYKERVKATLGLEEGYYNFAVQGFRFVVLDGNEMSTYANLRDSEKFAESKAMLASLKEEKAPNASSFNGGIGAQQMEWLGQVLREASEANERVILFCHFPVYPETRDDLWNKDEVIRLLESFGNVVAYINGHNHAGNYAEKNGIDYLTVHGMVETPDENAYAIIDVYSDRLEVRGTGREPDRTLNSDDTR